MSMTASMSRGRRSAVAGSVHNAQASKADVIALANGGQDTMLAIKQAAE